MIRAVGAVGQGFIVVTLGALYGGAILSGLVVFSERIAFILTAHRRGIAFMATENSILAVDFGNVHTRALLIDLVDGVYRLVAQAEEQHDRRSSRFRTWAWAFGASCSS